MLEPRQLLTGDTPGDDLASAQLVPLTPNVPTEWNATIGDGSYEYYDVDLFRVDLQAGQTIEVDVDAWYLDDGTNLSGLDSYLRIFDSSAVQRASNDSAASSNDYQGYAYYDAYLSFTAPSTGPYYIGVSSADNPSYDPTSAGSGNAGGTSGAYRLQLLSDSVSGSNQQPVAASDSYSVGQDATLTR